MIGTARNPATSGPRTDPHKHAQSRDTEDAVSLRHDETRQRDAGSLDRSRLVDGRPSRVLTVSGLDEVSLGGAELDSMVAYLSRHSIALVSLIALCAGHVDAVQRGALREIVRTHGDINRVMDSCGPLTGLKEIVEHTQWTVEGTIVRADAALHESDRQEFVYTDYILDVTRVFRFPAGSVTRSTPGATMSSPFLPGEPVTRATSTPLRLRLRAPYHGRVTVEGGSIADRSGFPTLRVGQHVITSAFFNTDLGEWVPFGVFEVRDGRVVALDTRLHTPDYDSVDAFAVALANPPPTVVRVR